MDQFIATLQKDKRRYAEPKAYEVLALGPANDTRIKILISRTFYFINLFQTIPNSLDLPDRINSEIVMLIDLR